MTRIICRASSCLFWEHGVCGAEDIEYEPDDGCLTFQDMGDLELEDADEEDEFDWDDEPSTGRYVDDDDDDWDDDDWEDDEEDFDL